MPAKNLLLAVIGFICLLGADEAMAIEEAPYRVLDTDGHFELRQYATRIVAETIVTGEFDAVGNEGFRRLAAYIGGKNRANQDIAMTAPVDQAPQSRKIPMTAPVGQDSVDGKWRITFTMPSTFSMDTLPEPLDPNITLREVPGQLTAAVRYSGTWSRTRYLDYENRLKQWMKTKGLTPSGEPVFARYNPPFIPWFLRRNEVLIPVEP
jgi:hypothetical protein